MNQRIASIASTMTGLVLLGVVTIQVLGSGVVLRGVHSEGSEQAQQAAQERALSIAVLIARHIDGDQHAAAAATHTESGAFATWKEGGEEVLALHRTLAGDGDALGLGNPAYTLYLDEGMRKVLASQRGKVASQTLQSMFTGALEPKWRAVGDYRPEMGEVFFDGRAATTAIYEDARGAWVSAYAPVIDSEGAVVALLAVDTPVSQALSHARGQTWTALMIMLVMAVSVAAFAVAIPLRVARGLEILDRAAARLGRGELDIPIRAKAQLAEIQRLIRSLEAGRKRLVSRIGGLNSKVEALESRLAEAEASVDEEVRDRRTNILDITPRLSTALAFSTGRVRAVVRDLHYGGAVVEVERDPGLVRGRPVALQVKLDGDEVIDHRAFISHARSLLNGWVEFRLQWEERPSLSTMPAALAQAVSNRSTFRVSPSEEAPVEVVLTGQKQSALADTRVIDLSASGMGVEVDAALEQVESWGNELRAIMKLPNDVVVVLGCRLVSIEGRLAAVEDGATCRLGLRFEKMRSEDFENACDQVLRYINRRDKELADERRAERESRLAG